MKCSSRPGTYNERIDYLGKAIAVRSSGGPEVTTIDGTDISGEAIVTVTGPKGIPPVGKVLAELDGFDVTGGFSPLSAGIVIEDFGLGIRNCLIQDNGMSGVRTQSATIAVEDTTILSNWAVDDDGGGMHCTNSVLAMTNCVIESNFVSDSFEAGGGLYLIDCDSTLVDCTIRDNELDQFTCGLSGGGAFVFGGTLSLT